MAALQTWTWGDDVPIEQRRKIGGSYSIFMHEDLLQAIFLQFIGVKWSVCFKRAFTAFCRFDGAWTSLRKAIPRLDKKRREYFLGEQSTEPSVQSKRQSLYTASYFALSFSTLPNKKSSSTRETKKQNTNVLGR
jgi:hypothetical protein